MLIDNMTPEQRKDAARLVHGYQEQAARARQADAEKSPDTRGYAESAQKFARDLWDHFGLNVENAGHRREIRQLLAGPDETVVAVHHSTLDAGEVRPFTIEPSGTPADDWEVYEFAVPVETAARWREALLAWTHAQQQMKHAWEAAVGVFQDHEEVQGLLSGFQYADEMAETKAAEAIREAEWDEEYGPREWAATTFMHKLSSTQSETRWRLHRDGCPSLAKVRDNSFHEPVHVVIHQQYQQMLRKHDAVKLLREGSPKARAVVACQRCAKDLEYAAESAAQDEARAKHGAWLDEQTDAPDFI